MKRTLKREFKEHEVAGKEVMLPQTSVRAGAAMRARARHLAGTRGVRVGRAGDEPGVRRFLRCGRGAWGAAEVWRGVCGQGARWGPGGAARAWARAADCVQRGVQRSCAAVATRRRAGDGRLTGVRDWRACARAAGRRAVAGVGAKGRRKDEPVLKHGPRSFIYMRD